MAPKGTTSLLNVKSLVEYINKIPVPWIENKLNQSRFGVVEYIRFEASAVLILVILNTGIAPLNFTIVVKSIIYCNAQFSLKLCAFNDMFIPEVTVKNYVVVEFVIFRGVFQTSLNIKECGTTPPVTVTSMLKHMIELTPV